MNILLAILTFPFVFAFSPLLTPMMWLSYMYDCNEPLTVNIINITRLDALQCGVLMYSPSKSRYISSPPIQCGMFTDCKPPLCQNATIIVNHVAGEKQCFRFVTNQQDAYFTSYQDSLQLFFISAIGLVLLLYLSISSLKRKPSQQTVYKGEQYSITQ